MIMRVLVINPPDKHMLSTNVPRFVDEHTGNYPPLGLLYIISFLEKHFDCEIKFIDCAASNSNQEEIADEVRRFAPNIVGIQMMTFTAIDAYQTACTVKKVDSEIFVVVGGPHPNIYVKETLSKKEIDCIILGEGEETFTHVVKNISEGKGLSGIPHVAYKEDGGEIICGTPGMITSLDSLPFPARKYLDLDQYYTIIGTHNRMTTFISSRGCPYKCLFCDRAYWGKIYRKRSPANVVDEIEECIEMGIKEFDFQDDTFTIDRDRVNKICDEIINRNLKIYWNIRARVNTVDGKLLAKLSRAGVIRIHYGIEAGTDEIIKVLRKNIDLEEAIRVFKLTKKAGIKTLAYFIIGSPFETREHILKTIEYITRLDPDFLHIGILTPFPSTDLYDMGLENGVLPYDYWKKYAEDLSPDFDLYYWEENLKSDELIDLLKLALKSFYGRPKYVVKQLLSINDMTDFLRKFKAGFSMIKYWQ